jgi:hypothetical protein
MPTSVAHAPMVCLTREVETLIGRAAGAWRQALECECRGDANAAVAWHLYARDLGERAERLARARRPSSDTTAADYAPTRNQNLTSRCHLRYGGHGATID